MKIDDHREVITFAPIMTERCNLRCKYCYVVNEKNKHKNKDMSKEVARDMLRFAVDYLSKNNVNVKIDLFGGEPLMNWDVCVYIIEEVRKIDNIIPGRLNVMVFTNATLLTEERMEYFEKNHDIVSFNFSLDGDKLAHDANRVFPDGSGSYDKVMSTIKRFAERRNMDHTGFTPMFTVSPNIAHRLYEVFDNLINAGFNQITTSLVREDVWTDETIAQYKEQMNKIADRMITDINNGILVSNNYLLYSYLDARMGRSKFCSAGSGQYGISPDGKIYPCQRFYNNDSNMSIGDVINGIDKFNPTLSAIRSFNHNMSKKCRNCELNNACQGQCFAAMWEDTGNVLEPIDSVCELMKINYEISKKLFDELEGNPIFEEIISHITGGKGIVELFDE